MAGKRKAARTVIAVTGSAGKTTTKEMIASILRRRWRIFTTRGNRNSWKHTRKYACQIKPSHRGIVLEYGMKRPGDIRRHCTAVRPDIGIITNVGTAHIGNVGGTIRGVARVKSELIHHMKQSGTLIVNADNRHSRLLETGRFPGRMVKVGIRHRADYQARQVRYRRDGMSFVVKLGGKACPFFVPIHGIHNVYNALFAIAAARRLGFSPSEIRQGLAAYRKLERRLTFYRTRRGARIIDDSFSANPNAVKAAIDVLGRVGNGRNIAVLGSMLEMGTYARTGHRTVGRYAAQNRVHDLFTYGNMAREIRQGAVDAGFPAARARHCRNRRELHRHLLRVVRRGSTVLVKGSHGLRMNRTVDFLRKHA